MKLRLKRNVLIRYPVLILGLLCGFGMNNVFGQERPFIWVRSAERPEILAKIQSEPWAQTLYSGLEERAIKAFDAYALDRDAYLRSLPVQWEKEDPVFHTSETLKSNRIESRLEGKLNAALDCAVMYYLTQDSKYAAFAADILHNAVQGYTGLAPSDHSGNGGWLNRGDWLLEARVIGCQLPVVYDLIYPHLKSGNSVYDVKTQSNVSFSFENAQEVFRTYFRLTRDHGHRGSNWSVLMADSMVVSILALDDEAERDDALTYYLHKDTRNQDSLKTIAKSYENEGDIWPESFQYSGAVSSRSTYLMTLLERYDPNLNLYEAYPNIPLSLSRISTLSFPNGDEMRFGDGHRHGGAPPFFSYEIVYQHARKRGLTEFCDHFGSRINEGIQSGQYNRASISNYGSTSSHNQPLQLLWFSSKVEEDPASIAVPRTDALPFAGIALQRNLTPDKKPFHALMCWVGGAHCIHGHANGMNIELYGLGHVLGADSGRTSYQTPIHENYYRLYAAHNTIIVNGASRGKGGWQGLEINTVQVESMEPAPRHAAVSPDISFTCTSFVDDKGDRAEAVQQRTLSLIRTSPASGYYVDIFRSRSTLENQFHDYIYHNFGDEVKIVGLQGTLRMKNDPDRFQNDIGGLDYGKKCFQQPGWRYFKETQSSGVYRGSVRALFTAQLKAGETCMQLFIPGMDQREYARVMAPAIIESPKPYDRRESPAIVIRKNGDAWDQPFAVVYEPHMKKDATIQSVQHLEQNSSFAGLKVQSKIGNALIDQYIISNDEPDNVYVDTKLNLTFQGRYAVLSIHQNGGSIYIGDGRKISYKGLVVEANGSAVWLEFSKDKGIVCSSNGPVVITLPDGRNYTLDACKNKTVE